MARRGITVGTFRVLVATVVLAMLTTGTTAAYAGLGPGRPSSPRAHEALAHATAVLTGHENGDATGALLDLRRQFSGLRGADRAAAQALLTRPASDFVICGRHVCVHWKRRGLLGAGDAPPATDANGNNVPDWVETTLRVMQTSWLREVDDLGYRPPLPDGTGEGVGPANLDKLDVYLQNLGGQGIYGYAATDTGGTTSSAYLVLDNDYAEFGAAPIVSLKATAAHEFFHAIQFAYDTTDARWFMESTATWMEEQVFDDVNDNRNYLPYSSLRDPSRSITRIDNASEYGNWIFYEYLSERLGRHLVHRAWRLAARPGSGARTAIAIALREHGTTLSRAFGRYSAASNTPRRAYQEGAAYPHAMIARSWSFGPGSTSTGQQQVSLDTLTAADYAFDPGALRGDWRLRIVVNAPSRSHTATALVFLRSGELRRVAIGLSHSGDGTVIVPFRPRRIAQLVLTIANASAYDDRVTAFRATARR